MIVVVQDQHCRPDELQARQAPQGQSWPHFTSCDSCTHILPHGDSICLLGRPSPTPLTPLPPLFFNPKTKQLVVKPASGKPSFEVVVNHTFNEEQIEWFKAGSALNLMRRKLSG